MKLPAPAIIERSEKPAACSQVTRLLQYQRFAGTGKQYVEATQLDVGGGTLQQERIAIRCVAVQ